MQSHEPCYGQAASQLIFTETNYTKVIIHQEQTK